MSILEQVARLANTKVKNGEESTQAYLTGMDDSGDLLTCLESFFLLF
jgi:hypothetical protein